MAFENLEARLQAPLDRAQRRALSRVATVAATHERARWRRLSALGIETDDVDGGTQK